MDVRRSQALELPGQHSFQKHLAKLPFRSTAHSCGVR